MATIIVALLNSNPSSFASKPSDMLGLAVMAGLVIFAGYVLIRALGSIDFKALMNGIAWLILLAFVACVLIVIFKVGYPGQ